MEKFHGRCGSKVHLLAPEVYVLASQERDFRVKNMNNFRGKNILVTGGTGFVGSHLVEELVKQKANVVTTFISTSPRSYFFTKGLNKKVKMAHVDIEDFENIYDLIVKNNIEVIFHLAAQALVETAFYNPRKAFSTNIIGTVNILESARLFSKVKAVVVASSDKAYGKLTNTSMRKYKENDPLQGDHPYEVSKSAADLISNSYFKTYKLPVVVTRFGNIYGEGDLNFSRIIPGIMKAIIKNEELEIRSNGKYIRDYLYVKDVVSGYLLLANNIEKIKGKSFNFGSSNTLSVIEVIKLCEKVFKNKINYSIMNTAKNEIPYQSLDFSKVKKILDWSPKYEIKKAIKKIKSWYENTLQ